MEGRQGLFLVLIMATCFYGNIAQEQRKICTQEAVADIVFLVDGSWSIGAENFEQIRRFLHTLVNSFDVNPDHVRIGLVQYSTNSRTEFLLNTFQTKRDILQYISKLPYLGGGTHTGEGLDFMLNNHFVASAGSRAAQNVPQIAVVITDGKSQDNVESHAQKLKRKGIVLYAIGIKDADEDQLKEIANEPHSQHVYSVSDFAALQGISQNIVQTLCTTVEEAKRQLLQLSQACSQGNVADIVFLVDGSSSIGTSDFQEVRLFLRSLITGLDIGADKVRIGLAQYSDEPHKEFLLKDHMDKTSMLAAVDNFPYRAGHTYTGKAIDFLVAQFFTEQAGSRARQRVPQIAVIITDGKSNDNVTKPAQRLRQHGVIVFGIGVGQADMVELEDIANRPSSRFRFKIDNYQALQRLTEGLLQTVCISADDQRNALAEKFSDIFFLVDSAEFQQWRGILTKLANQLNIGASANRLGLAQYGQDIKVEFLLNKHQTKDETQKAIKTLRPTRRQPTDPRNLGSALRYARTHFFTQEAGSRADQGFRQYLVVLSGKNSDDTEYHRESRLIKSSGITVVGMSLKADVQDTSAISTASYSYQFNNNAVPILKAIFETEDEQKNVTGECKGANKADIVFIIDESGSIGTPNFQMVRNFLYSIVNGLDVSQSKVRVGIVMYNDNAEAQVYLNAFSHKNDLLNFIKMLPYHGGGTKTGAALQFAQENVFVKSKGSRKDQGIQQVAVVITDGESQDQVDTPAANLRRAGVTVYSVGIKGANQTQLIQMASHPTNTHLFNVESFSKLQSLQQSLQKTLCHNIIKKATADPGRINKDGCLQTDEADIFFLIDHSGSIEYIDFKDMKKFILEFLTTFRVGPQHVRVGVAKYSDSPNLEIDVTDHSDSKTLGKAVEAIEQKGGGTETGKALTFMGPLFIEAEKSRHHKVPQFLVVITDGESSDKVKIPAETLRAQGITVYAIGVRGAVEAQLLEIAGDPAKKFSVNNFDALNPIKDDIIRDICSKEACKDVPSDLIFLIDSSGSIHQDDFTTMKNFMISVISKSDIGEKNIHVGVMQYNTNGQLQFPLNRHYSKQALITAIDGIQQLGGGTHTGGAISSVSQYFDAAQGGRPDIRQRLIVITDGESQDVVKGPAAALREKGVLIYAIGVDEANSNQLIEISGSPDRMYSERDFNSLKGLESKITNELCDPGRECKKIEKADIIFLVDFSKSISQAEFGSMEKYMISVVDQSSVGKDLTRFGVILYSDDPTSVFSLKQYDNKKDVFKAIKGMTIKRGDTYTGKALKYSLDYFNSQWGGRKSLNVPQILMVITDGEATDQYSLEEPSKALRDNGIDVFSIGVKGANQAELKIMAGDESRVFFVSDFNALESLYKMVGPALCNSTKKRCQKQKADLVFLLDQSSSIQPDDYKLMKNFTINIVNQFIVSEDNARIGLARFSTGFRDEFYLDRFHTNEAVNGYISNLEQKGGDTYLGDALKKIKEYFQASRGGRKSSGISQNLVIITDGEAHDSDDIEDAANHLRSIGIQMFVIGIGNIHDLELLQIAGTPKRLFTVNDFKSLESIKQKVIDTICDPEVYPPSTGEGCTIDIAMGFDISRVRNPGERLIEGHTKLWTFLPDIAQYVTSVSNLCCAKTDTIEIKIGFSLVNRDGVVLENFEKFDRYNRDLVTKVMTYNLNEPTYFNTALLQSFAKKFKDESRSGTKVLVIFSDGLDEDVWKLEEETEKLKQAGINALLVVALEGARNPAELQMVEFGRGFDYKLPLNIGMHSVAHTLLKQIDTVSDRVCCGVMCKCSGNEGVRGGRGGPGTKGVSGQKGYPGFPGEEGTAGDRGPPGPSGPQGVQGCSGIRGPKGFRGLRGDRGSNGEDGLDGVNGEQGVTGKEGSRGERGHSGNSGIPGIRGEAGIKGQRGLRGDPGEPGRSNTVPGPKGDAGSPGLPGAPGPDGKVAESGVVGQPGPNGRRGPPGENGQTGVPGEPGLPGIPGASGPQGNRGPTGKTGERGWPGLPGPQGGPGTAGGRGLAGRRGPNGRKGQPGETGGQGDEGAPGSLGMPGQDGRDGYGKAGTPGAKGDPGFPGYPGLQGEDGIKGTSGYPGRKGNLGRGGNSGRSGETGGPGEPGRPGHAGTRGPSGRTAKSECELVTYIRDNCACSLERSACPAYPTELVFGLDMSQDVKPPQFERQRNALLSLLEDIHISESNCPTGARVAVVGYSAYTKYLIRFQDYRQKKQLIAFVENIALERTSNKRNLGAAMSFVGQTLFKRVRSGIMMRKVAVFFSAGPSQDRAAVTTAMMEYRGQNIVPAVISLDNAPAIDQAMQVDDSGTSIFTVLRGDMAADLRRVKNCAICYDPCKRAVECSFIQEPLKPQEVDMDLVMVLDGSREVQADDFSGGQQLLVSLVEQLAVSSQPRGKNTQARVAMVQQSGGSRGGVGAEFGLQTFNSNHLMVEYISRNMTQRSGASALGQTVEYAYKELLMKAPQPRRKKCLLTVVGTQTAYEDRVKLNYISQKAKCEGVATFVVTVGERYNRTEVEQLAGLPTVQHLIHFNRMKAEEQGYAKRFIRVFLNSLNKGVNTYPHQTVKSTCGQLIDRGQEVDQGQEYGQTGLGQELIFGDESFQEQTGRRSQTGQIDVIEALTHGGSSQGVISRPRLNAQCELRADSGFQCGASYKVWFFDVSVAACSPLWYNGCGGNANRFNTENECFRTCVGNNKNLMQKPVLGSGTSKDACLLAQDPGSCQDYSMMWFYDTTQNECSRFWYGGCNGNGNRFKTQEDCENLCVSL